MSLKLIVDERERHVHRYSSDHWDNKINWEKKTITVGDYAITLTNDEGTRIIYSIERKSLKDFAASFKDGRYDNKNKIRYLQRRTGCRVMFIIEGRRPTNANQRIGGIPYSATESAIIHMETEYRWCFHYTKDEIDTAGFLCRLMRSLNNLYKSRGLPMEHFNLTADKTDIPSDDNKNDINSLHNNNKLPDEDNIESGVISNEVGNDVLSSDALLTLSFEKSDESIVRELWSAITGISVTTAHIYMSKYSIKDIITGDNNATLDEFKKLKYPNGRKISTRIANKLAKLNGDDHLRILARIPNLSRNTANLILAEKPLKDLLQDDFNFDDFKYGGGKKINKKVTENIKKYMKFKSD